MNRLPSLKQLHHLVMLFDYQHFGRAAEACFISQPTLSASITNLESILETPLLERDHKTFLFTPLGEEVVRRSRLILQEAAELTDYARNQGKPMQGTVRLACIPTIAPFILRELLAVCRRDYPDLNLLMREDTTDNALRLLQEGHLDLVILALPYPTPGLSTRVLCRDPFHLVLPRHRDGGVFVRDMSDWPDNSIFLLEKEHCLTGHALQACRLQDGKKINPFSATSLHTLIQLVASEQGVTFLPELAINSGLLDGSDLLSRPLPGALAYREIGLAWRHTSSREACWQALGDVIQGIVSNKQVDTNARMSIQ